jgi:hypothetical protein
MLSSRRKSTATRAEFRAGRLRAHVLLLPHLDPIPVDVEFLGNILDGGLATAPPYVVGKALGIEGVFRQEVEPLAFHLPATLTQYATHLDGGEDAYPATREIANVPRASVAPASLASTTASASDFLASNKSDDASLLLVKNSTHCRLKVKARGTRMRPTIAAVSWPNWLYKDVCTIQSPCEMPERLNPCGVQPCLQP